MPETGHHLLHGYSDTERQIFEAALEVFARKGKDGARMQEIADAADINKAMLHYYFRSKDRLYEEVFTFTMQRFMASFGAALEETPTFADTLRTFIDGYIEFARHNQDIIRLMMNENMTGGTMVKQHMARMKQADHAPPRVMTDKIRQAQDAGEIRGMDPDHLILTVVSGCLFFFIATPIVKTMHEPARTDWNGFVEARKEHLFDLIYNGLRATPDTPSA